MKHARLSRIALIGAVLSTVMVVGLVVAPVASALAASIASVSDAMVTETDTGSISATFTITLSESNGTTDVTYSTFDGSATAGSDYTATSGTVRFGPNETSKTVTVPVLGDTLDEADETFAFSLTSIDNGTFANGDPNGTGRIADNDATPTLSISDSTVTEGNIDTVTTTLTVTLSAPSGRSVAVDFATADGTATFSPGADYHSQSGRLVFNPGETSKTITLTVVSDTVDENNESFVVNLSNPVNATITDGQGTVTITDDDTAGQNPPPGGGGGGGGTTPTISITDATVTEGNGGTVQTTVTVTLSRTSTSYVGVDFTTVDNTATFSGADYHSQSGRLVFAPGETTKTLTLTVVGDTVNENNESFFVNLSAPTEATISDAQAVVTITDDDTGTTQPPPPPAGALPTITVSDATVAEGSNGDTKVSVTVSLSASSSAFVSVDFATTDGTATFAGSDYWRMSGRLVFAPGETSRTLTATVVGDVVDENNEVFYIDLSNPTNATVSDARSATTITDDDGAATPPPGGGVPAISITDATVAEGNADTTTTTLTLTLSAPSSQPISVDVITSDGTATFDGADFYSVRGRLVFQPGETTETLQITVNGDTQSEGDEVFYVDLTNPVNATIADARGAITIQDDDAPDASTTTLTIVKKRRIVARGTVVPPHPGDRVTVTLKKLRNGAFRTISTKRPLLGDALDRDGDGVFESNYRASFRRPDRGRCLVKAVFPGDADHERSVSKSRFRC